MCYDGMASYILLSVKDAITSGVLFLQEACQNTENRIFNNRGIKYILKSQFKCYKKCSVLIAKRKIYISE